MLLILTLKSFKQAELQDVTKLNFTWSNALWEQGQLKISFPFYAQQRSYYKEPSFSMI